MSLPFRLFLFPCFVFIFIDCTYENEPRVGFGSTAGSFALLQSSPAPGQVNVPLNAPIDLFFDGPPAAETVTLGRLHVYSGVIEILGEVQVDLLDQRIRFSTATPLMPNLRFQVHLSRDIRGLNGAKLSHSVIFDFSTAAETLIPKQPPPQGPTVAHLQPLWDRYCTSRCHRPPLPEAGVDLSAASAVIETLKNVTSGQAELRRVLPFDHAKSYLMRKLLDKGGFMGLPMPPTGPQLARHELRQIADWIDGGALP